MNSQWIGRIVMLALPVATSALAAHDARAQSYPGGYPSKPINLIVPFGPGSGNDMIARIVAQKVSENWSQPVVVDNKPGASGGIAMEITARAPPDGHTIVIASTSHIVNQFIAKVRYYILKDFAPVSQTGALPYVVAVTHASPVKSMSDLVASAKSKPGKMNYAAVLGGVPHFMGEMLKSARGLDIVMIPYKSTTDAEVDVIARRVEIWFTTLASALPLVKGGKVRMLGVSSVNRAAVLPEVPTMAEAGLPSVDVTVGCFFLTAAATPRPNIQSLNREIVKAIDARDVRDRLAAEGVEPKSSSTDELDALLKSEVARWGKIIEGVGHISVRLPGTNTYMLTRHSLGRIIVPDDMLVYDMSGAKLAGIGDRPGEAPIHHEIYRARPDVNSIVHYHGMHATAFSTSAKHTLRPIHLMGTLFADGLPIYPDPRLVSTSERGAARLYAHGSVVTGGDIEECVTGAFFLEENAHRAYLSCTLGKPQWIEPQMAQDATEELIRTRGPMRRVWAMVEVEGVE